MGKEGSIRRSSAAQFSGVWRRSLRHHGRAVLRQALKWCSAGWVFCEVIVTAYKEEANGKKCTSSTSCKVTLKINEQLAQRIPERKKSQSGTGSTVTTGMKTQHTA